MAAANRRDPLILLAQQQIVKLSAELEVQLSDIKGASPTIEICRPLRVRAAESLAALATINLFDAAEVQKAIALQNEVKRYDEWLGLLNDIVSEGIQYDAQMRDEDREELLDVLSQRPDGESVARELGLIEGADAPMD